MKRIKILVFISFVICISCKSEMNIVRINKPILIEHEENKKEIEKNIRQFYSGDSEDQFDEFLKKDLAQEDYFLKLKMNMRNKIVDSLGALKSENLIIIDYQDDSKGARFMESMFFFDNKIYRAIWSQGNYKTGTLENISNNEFFSNTDKDFIAIYREFIKDNPKGELIKRNYRQSYYVTKIKPNHINYYWISPDSPPKIIKRYHD